jgi:hypothetical protein
VDHLFAHDAVDELRNGVGLVDDRPLRAQVRRDRRQLEQDGVLQRVPQVVERPGVGRLGE